MYLINITLAVFVAMWPILSFIRYKSSISDLYHWAKDWRGPDLAAMTGALVAILGLLITYVGEDAAHPESLLTLQFIICAMSMVSTGYAIGTHYLIPYIPLMVAMEEYEERQRSEEQPFRVVVVQKKKAK